jgi:isoleucyl-tRNA synthetase
MADYKDTLNLPRTTFPMRANLPKNEPAMIRFWQENRIYDRMVRAGANEESFVLHDGPPYANGHIHLGTAMNKILKDIIVKARNMKGLRAEYVPGWDCHGLPIELKVEQEMGGAKKDASILDIRRACREYALKYLDIQREEFKRLGVLGEWDKPYQTMHPEYEAATARELTRFMERGSVMRHKKPIHWCPSCETALAEAEVEYGERTSPSVFVRFPVRDDELARVFPRIEGRPAFFLIWTTTPWTIPGNLAIAVHPDEDYVLLQYGDEYYVLAQRLLEECLERFGWSGTSVAGRCKGAELEGLRALHPLFGRDSLIVTAGYVTLDTGTGCVHTAPGHGQEDYETGLRYGLEVYSPLDDQGRFLPEVEDFAGLNVFQADPEVIDKLERAGHLVARERVTHSYPHCWRCKKPVIFRATTQWFISMEENGLRSKALRAIDHEVTWIPEWGKLRIRNMIAHRPDWCISRQRSWGVPIVALICSDCFEAYFDPQWARSVVERFASHPRGADYWFEAETEEIVPPGLSCPRCGSRNWRKETNILDVWFDSGTSFAAVLEQRPECSYPADMYLEGSDQHRGWFHSSLLASVGTRDRAPYRSVLTHGFVVDAHSRKMSKSLGNVIAPQDVMQRYGAEILRMWVASENYQEDMRMSEDILKQLVDNYRRIRNTCRYILGNLSDFSPDEHTVPQEDMLPLDRYALDLVRDKHQAMQRGYETYELHKVYHTLHNLCVNELSAFYLDILKDRLYVSAPGSSARRSAQTALSRILMVLIQDMAPILSFTAEEVHQHLPEHTGNRASVFEVRESLLREPAMTPEERSQWDFLSQVRHEVTKAIEPWRKRGDIGLSLDAVVTLYADGDMLASLENAGNSLNEFFIVSDTELQPAEQAPDRAFRSEDLPGLRIAVHRASGEKCSRCWNYSTELGSDHRHPETCPRCARVLQQLAV